MALLTDSPPESALMMTFELTRNTNNRGISESKVHPVYTCTYGAPGLVLQADTIWGEGWSGPLKICLAYETIQGRGAWERGYYTYANAID